MREANTASKRRGYAVTYESSSHWKVITQIWGSVWPKVCFMQHNGDDSLSLLKQKCSRACSRDRSHQLTNLWIVPGSSLLPVERLYNWDRTVACIEGRHFPSYLRQGTHVHEFAGGIPGCF